MCNQMKRILLLLFWLTCCNSIKAHGGPLAFLVTGLSEGTPQAVVKKLHIITDESEQEPIILDCEYDAENYQSSLLVKWLKNERPIYHWIKGHEPFLYPAWKELIDDTYEASTDPNSKYSSIKFKTPTKDLSGNYSCLVTMNTTRTKHVELQVIDMSQLEVKLDYETSTNETKVTCAVENIYPQPILVVTSDDDDLTINKISEDYVAEDNGFFNATTVVSANGFDADDVISCTVTFPDIEFNITKSITSSAATIIKSTTVILATIFIIFVNKV